MICLVISQSPFCIATIILYTLIWVPIQQLKNIFASFIVFITPHQPIVEISEAPSPEPWLPVSRFGDLPSQGTNLQIDDTCSICLVEFEGEDVVSELSKCGHVFHMKCIEKWLDCNNFTCPLCRSSFLQNVNANSHAKQHYGHVDFNPHISSYLGYSWH